MDAISCVDNEMRLLHVFQQPYEYEQVIDLNDEVLTVQAYFKPLVLSSLTKDLRNTHTGQVYL